MSVNSLESQQAPLSPFYERWAKVVIRYRWLLLILSLTVTAIAGHFTRTRLMVDTSFESMLASDSEPVRVLEDYRDNFGNDITIELLIEGDVFSPSYLERLKKLHEEIMAIDIEIDSLGQRLDLGSKKSSASTQQTSGKSDGTPEGFEDSETAGGDEFDDFSDSSEDWGEETSEQQIISKIDSLVNARYSTFVNGGLVRKKLFGSWPPSPEEIAKIKKVVLDSKNQSGYLGMLAGKEGRFSLMVVRTEFMNEEDRTRVNQEIEGIAKKYNSDQFKIRIVGLPALGSAINSKIEEELQTMGAIALSIMILFLVVIFRHPWGIIGPILVVIQSAIWTLGLMAINGVPVTAVTNILPTFILCVGLAASVHVQSVYRDARKDGMPGSEAVIHAIAVTGIPIFFTTLTTCVGLYSFKLGTLQAIQDMGTYGAFGVAVSLFHTLVTLPIILTFNKKSLLGVKSQSGKKDFLDRFLDLCKRTSQSTTVGGEISHKRRRATILTGLILMCAGLVGVSKIGVSFDPLNWLPSGDPTIDSFQTMNREMGGAAYVLLLIEAKKGKDLRERELLEKMAKLEDYIQAYRAPETKESVVGNIFSLLDVVRESYYVSNNEKEEFYRIPDTQRAVNDTLFLFEISGRDELLGFTTSDYKKSFTAIRVQWMDAWAFIPLNDYIKRGIKDIIGDSAQVKVTGSINISVNIASAVLTDLVRSFGTAFLIIAFTMILLLRRLKLGLISMVPNLLPMIMVMGFMGFAGIKLDIVNIMIWSIAIGLIVDNTIHFLHQYRAHYEKIGDVDAAIDHAFSHTGRAITATTLILVSGFLVFLTAHLVSTQMVGKLLGLSLTMAMLTNLVFAPALLRTLYKSRPVK